MHACAFPNPTILQVIFLTNHRTAWEKAIFTFILSSLYLYSKFLLPQRKHILKYCLWKHYLFYLSARLHDGTIGKWRRRHQLSMGLVLNPLTIGVVDAICCAIQWNPLCRSVPCRVNDALVRLSFDLDFENITWITRTGFVFFQSILSDVKKSRQR